jgi:hypothetical protein
MPCNYSGYFDYKIAGRFAVVDYDWSNAKEMWANPGRHGGGLSADGKMDCEERLLQQAAMTKAHAKSLGIDQQVWVYRNLVKGESCTVISLRLFLLLILPNRVAALPWYSTVRAKLNDSRFSDFFLKFDDANKPFHTPQCDTAVTPPRCTDFYHDQSQSPQSLLSTSGASFPGTNCSCKNCGCCIDGACDVGPKPSGEFTACSCSC